PYRVYNNSQLLPAEAGSLVVLKNRNNKTFMRWDMMAARLGRVAILLCLVLVASTGARALSLNDTADLEAFFDGVFAIQQLQYNVPGIAVAVVKDGEVLLAKGYGYADLANKEPVDPVRTLHRAASNTKVLVWTAVMQLVEAGKLDLHKDVNE